MSAILLWSVMGNTRRLVELVCFVGIAITTLLGGGTMIFWRRTWQPDHSSWCGPSHRDFSVNITGSPLEGDTYNWTDGGLIFPPGTFWIDSGGHVFACPCSRTRCLRKCCNQKVVFDHSEECAIESNSTNVEKFIQKVYSYPKLKARVVDDKYFFVLHGMSCDGDAYISNDDQEMYLLDDGRLFANRPVDTYLDQAHYCLESYDDENSTLVVECSEIQIKGDRWIILLKAYGMIASVPFLLATLMVYALVPSLRNLYGKSVMCHVICLTLLYGTNATIQLYQHRLGEDYKTICVVTGYVLQFAYLSTFFWLNVICFDIWSVFSTLAINSSKSIVTRRLQEKKFLIYSCYAWGAPVLISIVTVVMDTSSYVPEHYVKPQMGALSCWLTGFDAMMLYVYLPIGALMVVNLLMFITTIYRLRTHEVKARSLNRSNRQHYNDSRLRCRLYAKFFAVMGINWTLEVVSFISGDNELIWLLSDLGNTLHGVIIFYFLICKSSMLDQILSKLRIGKTGFSVKTSWVSRTTRTSTANKQSSPRCLQMDPGLAMTELKDVIY